MKSLVFSAIVLSITILCPVWADDLIPLTLDYQAQTYAYAYAQRESYDDDSDNDTGINQGCNSQANARAVLEEICAPKLTFTWNCSTAQWIVP